MCGIFGYIGDRNAGSVVVEGLKRLEYRGYDSWGVAVTNKESIHVSKQVGAIGDIAAFTSLPKSQIAIGHTRWATHGGVTNNNAHPHYASDRSFVLAQNGIVENYEILKNMLEQKGYRFHTQTDTEVIVRLIESLQANGMSLQKAITQAFEQLIGRNTIIVLTKQNQIFAARNGSPLVIGHNTKTNELFFSSDTLSFAPYANEMLVIDNGEMVMYDNSQLTIQKLITGKNVKVIFEPITFTSDAVDKEGFEHFMLKEIFDTPVALRQLTRQDKQHYLNLGKAILKASKVYTIGSGTAGIAAAQIAYYLRQIAKINAISLVGADAREYYEIFQKGDLLIAPSQSGETADVLEVLEYAKSKGIQIASLVNMPGSMITKVSDYPFMAQAGPEICVMSTKVFTSQIAWGYLIAKTTAGQYEDAVQQINDLANVIQTYLQDANNHTQIKQIAELLKCAPNIFLLGKSQNFQIMKEGMVKLIEATYKHAHALPAGDLKHYAITLIEKGVPVIIGLSSDEVKADVLNAAAQVKTRGATTIGIASEVYREFDYVLTVPERKETSAIMHVIPLQLLAYYMTVLLGNNVDKPRNIAKSVTVK